MAEEGGTGLRVRRSGQGGGRAQVGAFLVNPDPWYTLTSKLSPFPQLKLLHLRVLRGTDDDPALACLRRWRESFVLLRGSPIAFWALEQLCSHSLEVTTIEPERMHKVFAEIGGGEVSEHMKWTGEQRPAAMRAECRAEGKAEGLAQALRRVLERRFGALPAFAESRLRFAQSPELERWRDRAVTEATLGEE